MRVRDTASNRVVEVHGNTLAIREREVEQTAGATWSDHVPQIFENTRGCTRLSEFAPGERVYVQSADIDEKTGRRLWWPSEVIVAWATGREV